MKTAKLILPSLDNLLDTMSLTEKARYLLTKNSNRLDIRLDVNIVSRHGNIPNGEQLVEGVIYSTDLYFLSLFCNNTKVLSGHFRGYNTSVSLTTTPYIPVAHCKASLLALPQVAQLLGLTEMEIRLDGEITTFASPKSVFSKVMDKVGFNYDRTIKFDDFNYEVFKGRF